MPAPRSHKKNAATPAVRRGGKRTPALPAPARRRKQPGPGPHPQLLCCLGVLEGIADPAVIYDTHSVAAGANSAARRAFGFDPAGMKRSAVIDRLSGRPLPILQPALGGKTVREREYRFHDPRGGERTVLASARPVRAERKIIGAQEVWRDVTAQRHLENFLRSSEARYRSLFEESQSYNIVIGPDGTVRDVNRLLLKSLVYHKAEVIGRPFLYFVAPGGKQWALEVLRKATAGKLTHNIDITLRARDGSPRIVMFSPRKITIQEKGIVIGTLFTGLDITERKEAEEALARTNAELEARVEERTAGISRERQRLYNVLETLPAYVILLDRRHRTPFANKVFRERFGDPGDRRCYEYLFGRSEACENCETFKVLKTNRPHRWEWTGPDGRIYDVYDYPFVEADGSILVLEMGIDIAKQKQAQESLRSAAQYARSLIEASLDPLVTISPEGKITDVNETTIRATGLSRKNLIGTDFSRYFTEPEKARAGYRQVFATGSVTDYPLTIRHRNGRLMDVLYNASVYRDSGGKMLGVFAAARDVTERKRAEAAVRKERQRLFDVFETLPVMICLLTRDYHVVYANRSFRQKFGESRGRRCYEYCFGLTEPCKFCQAYQVFQTGQPHHWELSSPDGSVIDVYDFPFTDVDGSPMILEMDIDITRRRKAERELAQIQAEMAETKRLSSIGALAATVAHELRTPLGTIGLAAANLQKKAPDDALAGHIEKIRRKVEESNRIISNLLTYTRIKMPRYENIRLDRVIEEALKSVRERYPRSRVRVKTDLKALEKTNVRADEVQLFEIFNNVVTNAYQAIGNQEGLVSVNGRLKNDTALLSIRDNGGGIDEDELKRVFEPFYSGKTSGTGLGLTLSKELIELHGGSITIASEKDKGATVTLAIPLHRGP